MGWKLWLGWIIVLSAAAYFLYSLGIAWMIAGMAAIALVGYWLIKAVEEGD